MKQRRRKIYKLKRELGLFEITLCGVGIILGAGIYALVGKAAALGGNAIWLSFLLAAFVAALTGLSYCELSSMFPRAGAEYVYADNAFGRRIAFFVGFFLVSGITIAAAAVSLGFAGYFSALFNTPIIPTAIGLLVICTLILLYGVKESVGIGVLFTLVEVAGLFIIIAIGLPRLGTINLLEMPLGLTGVFGAAALIFFAFIGFEEIVNLAEEAKNPTSTVPKAVILSIVISTIIYVLVALAAVSVIGWEQLGASASPLADVAAAVLGSKVFTLIAVIALFSTANTVLLMLLANSRLAYGMSVGHAFPDTLKWVHPTRRTPWVTILLISLFSVLFLFVGGIKFIADITNLAIFITFIVINAAVIALRYSHPHQDRPFRIPMSIGKIPLIPLLGIFVSVFMLAQFSFTILLFGLGFGIFAFAAYEVIRWLERRKAHA